MKMSKFAATVGLAAAVSISLAACGSSSKTSSGSGAPSATSTAATVTVAKLTGTQTAVTLDTTTAATLTKLGIKVGLEGSAKMVTLPDGGAVAFPITGGNVTVYPKTVTPYVQGIVHHAGSGLSFTVGSKVLKATDFDVDPGASILYATVGGTAHTPLFALDGSALQISMVDGTYHLDGTIVKLLPAAAAAINSYFGVPAGTVPDNTVIGVAHIVAAG